MAGVLLFLLIVPLALATLAFFVFRFLALKHGRLSLTLGGTVWVSTLCYWTFARETACELPPSGYGDNGCGFVSFLGPLETASAGAATVLTLLCLIFWFHRVRASLTKNGNS